MEEKDDKVGKPEERTQESNADSFGVLKYDEEFRYQLLGRLQSDCEYYLGYGFRSPKILWANTEDRQIQVMRALHDSFPDDGKPEWLTLAQIDEYENKMC